jgi:hypothetical protein
MSNALIPVGEIQTMATAIAKSGLFGMKTAEQAMALMLVAQAEGYSPALAARDYHVIQGRPALKADAMLARFQAAGGKVEWKRYTDQEVSATFSHPQGGTLELSWTFEQAKRIGLTGKDNWRNYPRAMLRARVISEGIRTIYPGVVAGSYTPEEVQDFDAPKTRDMGSVEVVSVPESHQVPTEPSNPSVAAPEVLLDPGWTLSLPGKETLHCLDEHDFRSQAVEVCAKLNNPKLDARTRDEKLEALMKANAAIFARLGIRESVELMGEMRAAAHGAPAGKQIEG